jgi:hypothetical protein
VLIYLLIISIVRLFIVTDYKVHTEKALRVITTEKERMKNKVTLIWGKGHSTNFTILLPTVFHTAPKLIL